ncbi:MAG: addiction module protein [Saprospiraceae bacterium]
MQIICRVVGNTQQHKEHLALLKNALGKKAEQAKLMHFMVELLASDDFELSEEWKAELDRREEAMDNGTAVGRPAKDVIAKYTSH